MSHLVHDCVSRCVIDAGTNLGSLRAGSLAYIIELRFHVRGEKRNLRDRTSGLFEISICHFRAQQQRSGGAKVVQSMRQVGGLNDCNSRIGDGHLVQRRVYDV